MLLRAAQLSKSIGAKNLFDDVTFSMDVGDKVALIGRNGQGKTTLLKLIAGVDPEYDGILEIRKNAAVTLTRQEHHGDTAQSGLAYILDSVPHFTKYGKILSDFEKGLQTDIHLYTKAMEYYSENGYYYIQDLMYGT